MSPLLFGCYTVSRAAEEALADALTVNRTIHKIALAWNDARSRTLVEKACMNNKFNKGGVPATSP